MNFSDETVEKVASAIGNSAVGMVSADWSNEAKAALQSLTLADLMWVDEVRELVECSKRELWRIGDSDDLARAIARFAEAK